MSKQWVEQLVEKEMAEYLDAACADYGSARCQLNVLVNNVLELVAKHFDEHTWWDTTTDEAAEEVRNMKVKV